MDSEIYKELRMNFSCWVKGKTGDCPLPQRLNPTMSKATREGFSILELIVTMFIMVMVTVSVLQVLHHVDKQTAYLQQEMVQQKAVLHSLDYLMGDIMTASNTNNFKLSVKTSSYGWQDTARLTIFSGSTSDNKKSLTQTDWVSVPRYQEGEDTDLVLFRRHKEVDDKSVPLYIQVCENLYSFKVQLLDSKKQPVLKGDPELIVATAEIYLPGTRDSERVRTVNRTLCLNRFFTGKSGAIPGAAPTEASETTEETEAETSSIPAEKSTESKKTSRTKK